MYGLHGLWFYLSVEPFDALHYSGMALYKIGMPLFNLVPYRDFPMLPLDHTPGLHRFLDDGDVVRRINDDGAAID